MVQLFLDPVTCRVTGYNAAVPDGAVGEGLVSDGCLAGLQEAFGLGEPLYYVGGRLVHENPDADGSMYDEIRKVDAEITELQARVDAGAGTFMDAILSGMSLEGARAASQADRDALDALRVRREALRGQYKEMAYEAAQKRFEGEEEGMQKRFFLSMVTIVRDENGYLEEWIRYHVGLGFEHFYIYDNESEVPVQGYLESVGFPYLGRVTVLPWKTSRASQEDAHTDFLKNHAPETRWFLAADPDEYVVLKGSPKTLTEFLEENSQYATIKCLWKHYNANGQEEKTPGTDMERFTQATDWEGWKHGGKKFAQSNRISRFQSYVPIERMGARTLGWEDEAATDFFQLNHYVTRSWEEWKQKIHRGSSNPGYRRRLSMFFELNPDMAYLDTGEDMEQGYGPAGEGGGASSG